MTDDPSPVDVSVVTAVEAQASKATGVETPPREDEMPSTPPPEPQTDPLASVRESPTDALEALELPGTPAQRTQRRRAVLKAYLYLRDRGEADRAAIESDVFPDAPACYDRPETWWSEVVRPASNGSRASPEPVTPGSSPATAIRPPPTEAGGW